MNGSCDGSSSGIDPEGINVASGVANNDGIADGTSVVDGDDGDGSNVGDDDVGIGIKVEVGVDIGVDVDWEEDEDEDEDDDVGDCVNCDDDNVGEVDADDAADGCDDPVGD